MRNRFDVSGKFVIVTGGTKGLGQAIARGFADSGASDALCSRNQAECEAEAERMAKETGSRVIGFGCDVGKWDEVPAFVEKVINPGPFLTPLMLFGETVMPGRIASYDKLTMLRRIGDPEEIVGPCIYLASDASSYVTGEVHDVGGGMR